MRFLLLYLFNEGPVSYCGTSSLLCQACFKKFFDTFSGLPMHGYSAELGVE